MLLVIGGLFALWYKGGSEISTHVVDIKTGKPSPYGPRLLYRGIEIPVQGEKIILFKRYYAIVWQDFETGLITHVSYEQDGYNQFFIFYENGKIAAHGDCFVKSVEPDDQIMYDTGDVEQAQYYDPNGNEISSVKDGTGTILLYFSDGSKYFELELDNYLPKRKKIWSKDGSLKVDKIYENPVNPVLK